MPQVGSHNVNVSRSKNGSIIEVSICTVQCMIAYLCLSRFMHCAVIAVFVKCMKNWINGGLDLWYLLTGDPD